MTKTLLARALSLANILLIVTYFLAPTATASFFPSYLIGMLGLCVIGLEIRTLIPITLTVASLVALFAGLLVSNLVTTNDIGITSRYFGYVLLILTFLIGFYVCTIRVPWFQQAFMVTAVAAASISSLLSIGFYFLLDYQPLDEQRLYALGRLNNPVISAISYGSILCLVLTFVAETREIILRFLAGLVAICLISAILLTESRGVWLALGVTVLVILTMHNWRSRAQLIATVSGLGLVLLIVFGSLYQLGHIDVLLKRSLSFRPEIWRATLSEWINASIWLGAGISNTIDLTIPPNKFLHPHSIYLSTLYYGGLLGAFLFLIFIARLIWVSLNVKSRGQKIYAVPLLAFGLVVLVFDGNKIIEKVDYLWLCLWLPVALLIVAEFRATGSHQKAL